MLKKSSSSGSGASSKFKLSAQTVSLVAIAWATIALLFFLLFSVPLPGQGRPEWYSVITYILEDTAFWGAGWLCFRNWRSSQIVSGRLVWLAIGLGMFSYFAGNLILAYWELGLGKSPDVSPADLFYILTYLFLGWGMFQAVIARRLSLTPIQWLSIAGIALGSIALAYVLAFAPIQVEEPAIEPAVVEQASPTETSTTSAIANSPAVPANPEPVEETGTAPGWALAIEGVLSPAADLIGKLYIICDVILVVMATTLLLAFWGGRFSLSWRFISAAALSFYISDMWFYYATSYIANYQTGALPEVFWIFSGCLFAVGAALEYDLSTRSRRTTRRRT